MIVLVGHGNSAILVVEVWMVALFLVAVAYAQKSSRYVSNRASQFVTMVPQSA